MVFTKKIFSIILCILAVSALCALGVGATEYYAPSGYSVMGLGTNDTVLSLPTSKTKTSSGTVRQFSFRSDYSPALLSDDYYIEIEFSLPFLIDFYDPTYNSNYDRILVGTSSGGNSLASSVSDFHSFSFPGVTGFWYKIYFNLSIYSPVEHLYLTPWFYSVRLSQNDVVNWDSFLIATDYFPPEPTPDPYGSYYTAVDPLSSSFLKFKEVDSFSGLGTDKFFYADSSSPKLLFGKYLNPDDDIFSQYNVITVNAICSLSIPNPNYSFPTVSASCIFSNYADPTKAGWSSSPVSTYSNPAIEESFFISDIGVARTFYSYQCVIYLDNLTNFSYDYLSVIFSASNNVNGIYLAPVVYNVYIDERSSVSDPLVDIPIIVEKVWDDMTADEVYDSELSWAERAGASWLTGGDVDAIREIINSNTGIWGDYVPLTVSLDNLYSVLTYSGTSGSIMLPSATIPWGDSTLHLWDSQQIPFNYFIDNLPSQLHIIFAFIVLFSYLSVVGTLWIKLFINMFKGNYNF